MKFKKFYLIVFSLCLLPSLAFAGTSYYADCSASANGNGSYASPWNNIASVNAHAFSKGDDVYFKVNTTCTPADVLYIDWDGEFSDKVIIGAYYGNGQFGLNGNSRPIFDGNLTVPGNETGMIRYYKRSGNVTIKDLHVKNVWGYGIEVNKSGSYNTVVNCYTQNTHWAGIIFSRVSYSTIKNNIVERASYNRKPGPGISVNGANNETTALYNTVRGNTVYWCYEGIGVYKGPRFTTVENNIVYDNRSYHIYVSNARNATIRYNLVYETPNQLAGDGLDFLVGTACEGHADSFIKVTGNVEIYGNLIAGGLSGIFISNGCNELDVKQKGNRVYNNTIVDCISNFHFWKTDSLWSDNLIKNNISRTITAGSNHTNMYSPTGVVWSHNNFDESVRGNAAAAAKIYSPGLKKTSGWRSLPAGHVDGREFSLTSSSQNRNNGLSIAGYNDRIYAVDYPFTVNIATDNIPDIGAWMQKNEKASLDPPSQLLIIGTD